MQRIIAALRSSNAKVQWNACHAAGQALRRSGRLRGDPAAATQLAPLLDGLLEVLTTSTNYKSRTQAAAALEGLSAESATPQQRDRALEALSDVLESVHGRTPVTRSDDTLDARTTGGGGQSAEHPNVDMTPPVVPQQSDVAFSELRYRAGLLTQLQTSLQHLQALGFRVERSGGQA